MRLDLRALKELHPRLPATTAAEYANRAAVALLRQRHSPVCDLLLRCDDKPGSPTAIAVTSAMLDWEAAPRSARAQLDDRRITEDGAEAVALALVKVLRRWTVLRRMQQGERADWLLHDSSDQLVALEVSGIDGPPAQHRITEKLEQVRGARIGDVRAACVVAFAPPEAALESAD